MNLLTEVTLNFTPLSGSQLGSKIFVLVNPSQLALKVASPTGYILKNSETVNPFFLKLRVLKLPLLNDATPIGRLAVVRSLIHKELGNRE